MAENSKKLETKLVYVRPTVEDRLVGIFSSIVGLVVGIGGASLLYQNGLCNPEGASAAAWMLPPSAAFLYWGYKCNTSGYVDSTDIT